MASNVENIKGIGLSVVADATQVRRTFEEAIAGLRDRTVQMKLSVVKDGSVDRILREIRQTKVTVDVAFSPSRETVRGIRRELKTRLEAEGGIPIPVKIKAPTQAEGAAIHAEIVKAIGTPIIPVILDPRWRGGGQGPGGPPGGSPQGGGGGGPTGGGGAPAASFRQPVRQATAPSPEPIPDAPAADSGQRRVSAFRRREEESEDQWRERLLEQRAIFLARLDSTSEKVRTKANNKLAQIDKALGEESPRTRRERPATDTSDFPERVSASGQRVRGGPSVGPLPEAGPTDWERVARDFFQNQARRASDIGFHGQRATRGAFQPEAITKLETELSDLGEQMSAATSDRQLRKLQDREATLLERLEKARREFTPEEQAKRRAENRERIDAQKETVEGSFEETLKRMPAEFQKAFSTAVGQIKGGDLRLAKEGLKVALDDILARGNAPKSSPSHIPGVGPRTVQRILDPEKGAGTLRAFNDTPQAQERLGQQQDFAFQVDTLRDMIGAIGTAQADITRSERKRRRRRKSVPDRPQDPLREEAHAAAERVADLEQKVEAARGAPTDRVDQATVDFLQARRISKPGTAFAKPVGPKNITILRKAAKKLADAPETPIEDLLPEHILKGQRSDTTPGATFAEVPEPIQAIIGAFHRARRSSPEVEKAVPRGRRRSLEKAGEDLISLVGREPEQIALTPGPPDRSNLRQLEGELAEARVHLQDVTGRRAESLRPVKVEVEDVEPEAARTSTRAAEGVTPTGAAPPIPPFPGVFAGGAGEGGEGGGIPFFGGGGGVVQVEVVNWPEALIGGFSGGSVAAAEGITPATLDRLAQLAVERGAETATAAAGAPTPTTGKGKAKKKAVAKSARPHLTGSPRSEAQRLANLGLLSEDEAEAIANPPISAAPTGLDLARQQIEEQLAQARQGLPIRSFPVSIAQTVAGPQRGAAFARFSQAGSLLSQAGEFSRDTEKLTRTQSAYQKALDEGNKKIAAGTKLTKDQKTAFDALPSSIKEIGERIAANNVEQEKLVKQASELAKLTRGEQFANLGKSLVGSLGGTLAYGAALGVVGAGLAGVAAAALPALERTTGYRSATRDLTDALSDQARAQGGAIETTVAAAAAQANLSERTYDTIKAQLEQRAAVEAGNKAYDEQVKLFAASQNVGGEQRRVGSQRFDKGLFETTGGFVVPGLGIQTPFFGTPSTQELLARQLEGAPDSRSRGIDFLPGGGGAALSLARTAERIADGGEKLGGTLDFINEKFRDTGVRFVASTDEMAASAKEGVDALKSAGFRDLAGTLEGRDDIRLSREAVQLTPEELASAVNRFAERNARPDAGVLLQTLQERIIPATLFGIQQGLRNELEIFAPARRGIQFTAQPPAPFGRGLVPGAGQEPQIPTSVTSLPVFGDAFAQQSGVTGVNGRFSGVPEEAIASFNRYRDEAQLAIDAINSKAEQGRQVLAERLGVPQSTIAELQAFGQRIGEINQQQADLRLDLQYSQYNRQLFIARRTLGDITGLLGRAGGTQIGYLQREQLLLGRRSQALSLQSQQLGLQTGELQQQSAEMGQQQNLLQLQLSQRQINFQRAIAGFTAPGATPEERAARIEEAEIEADFAQKQLDFQKQQFKLQEQQIALNRDNLAIQREAAALARDQFQNQVALQDATNERGFQDQLDAIAELQKAFSTGVEIQALEDLKGAITAQRDLFIEELNAQVSAEQEFIKAQAQFTTDLFAQTGQFVTGTVFKVRQVFDQAADAFERSGLGRFLNFSNNSGGGGAPTTGGRLPGDVNEFRNAPGFLGKVNQPTSMMMGEAGTELVAVLRNPRPVLGFGGGQQQPVYAPVFQISISGNTVRSDSDLEQLSTLVARKVEEKLGRRMSSLGLSAAR